MKLFHLTGSTILAGLIGLGAATPGIAYTLDQAAQPRELPPASYSGDVYVDSRGCAYARGSVGGSATWVARLENDRKTVICGLTPTFAPGHVVASGMPAPLPLPAPEAMVTATAPATVTAAPTTTVSAAPATTSAAGLFSSSLPTPSPAPAPTLMPSTNASAAATPTPAATASGPVRTLTITCPAPGTSARVRVGADTVSITCAAGQTRPVSYLVQHGNGETTRLIANPPAPVVMAAAPATTPVAPVTTTASGGLVSTSPQVHIGGTPPGGTTNGFGNGYGVVRGTAAPPLDPVPQPGSVTTAPTRVSIPAQTVATMAPRPMVSTELAVPEGYRAAWSDGRLNPNRGPRTAEGDAQMAAIYDTTRVPMREIAPTPANGLIAAPSAGGNWVVATKSPANVPVAAAPVTPAASGYRYVQVGMFNVPANADAAAAKLRALGLPGKVAYTASGRRVVVVGPFADAAALQNALSVARRAGFADAYLRS